MKRISKKIFVLIFALILAFIPLYSVKADQTSITYLPNGDYIETTLSEFSTFSSGSKTGSKTSTYNNSSGTPQFSITVNGSFTYNGSTATCTGVSGSYHVYSNLWSISGFSTSRSGNAATARCTGTCTVLGVVSTSKELSVTLRCKPDGTLY